MKSKKLNYLVLLGVSAIVSMTAVTSAFATISGTGTISVTDNRYSLGYFTAVTTPTTGPNLGTFNTFCLNRYVGAPSSGSPYSYYISDAAVPGSPTTSGNPNPISIGTAWIFSQFTLGFLGGSYNNNWLIQEAIWALEGDLSYLVDPSKAYYTYIKQAEIALFGGFGGAYDTQVIGNANGAYGVYAVNSTRENTQPFLVVVPEPSTIVAGALLMIPFGLSGWKILRRNKMQ